MRGNPRIDSIAIPRGTPPAAPTAAMRLRHAVRALARTPGFSATAIATLALGIGLNTVVFTAYDAVALRRLPVRAPGEIVRLEWRNDSTSSDQFSWAGFERLSRTARSFASVLAASAPQKLVALLPDSPSGATGAINARPAVINARMVSSNYFDALGIAPERGRLFIPRDRLVAVVSHAFWKTALRGDPDVSGQTIEVSGAAFTVIGVAPEKFAGTGAPPETPAVWIPASAQGVLMPGVDWIHDDAAREWQVLARLRPGATPAQHAAELAVLAAAWPPEAGRPVRLSAIPARFFNMSGGAFDVFQAVCAVLMVAVALILLIGCVNLTNLIAARNSGRTQEIALRLALGASRWQLVRQFCLETTILGVLGGGAGFLLSAWSCAWLAVKTADFLERFTSGALGLSIDVSPDWRVFFWTAAVSILTGIGVGVLPALRASRGDVSMQLKRGTAASSGGDPRERSFLLAAQVASCLILLSAAGLLFRGASRSTSVSPGFEMKRLAVIAMDPRGITQSAAARAAIERDVVNRLRALPQVESVAWADRAPFLGTASGLFRNQGGSTLDCAFNGISENYFETLRIPLLAGRAFTPAEIEANAAVAVISSSAAARLWPHQDPIGKQIAPVTDWLARIVGRRPLTVIGVAKAVRSTYLSKDDEGYVYTPRGFGNATPSLLVRTRIPAEKSLRILSDALAEVNRNLPPRTAFFTVRQGPARMQVLMAEAPAAAASALGFVALLLACTGIYGVVAHLVARRTREIGIRIALGASRRDVIAAIGDQTLRPVAWGAAAGMIGAFAVSGLLRAMIAMPDVPDLTFGAGAFDATAFLGAALLLIAVVVLAAFVPLQRATRIEPAMALRDE